MPAETPTNVAAIIEDAIDDQPTAFLDEIDDETFAPMLRIEHDQTTIERYAALYDEGHELPPIVCYELDGYLVLVDGWHRLRAQDACDREEVAVEIRQGTHQDALLYAIQANQAHGLPLRTADRMNMARAILGDEHLHQLTDREIARRTGLSPTTVGKIRAEIGATCETRVRADGTKVPASTGATAAATRAETKAQAIAAAANAPASTMDAETTDTDTLTVADLQATARGLGQRIAMRWFPIHVTKARILAALHIAHAVATMAPLGRIALRDWVGEPIDDHASHLATAALITTERKAMAGASIVEHSLTPRGTAIVHSVISYDEQYHDDERSFPDPTALEAAAIKALQRRTTAPTCADLESDLRAALAAHDQALPPCWYDILDYDPAGHVSMRAARWYVRGVTDQPDDIDRTPDGSAAHDQPTTPTKPRKSREDQNPDAVAALTALGTDRAQYLMGQAAPHIARAERISTYAAQLITLTLGLDFNEMGALPVNYADAGSVTRAFQTAALGTLQLVIGSPPTTSEAADIETKLLPHIHKEFPGLDWPALVKDADLRFNG